LDDQIKKNEKGGECNTHGVSSDTCRVLFGRPWKGNHFEEVGLYERIILKQMLKKCNEGAELDCSDSR
jgi:hypothetical protein